MYGDIASFLVYNKKTSAIENENIRTYFDNTYLDGNTLNTSSTSLNNIISNVYPNHIKVRFL